MAAAEILPYELYSDAPGTLFVKHEWEEVNADPSGFNFGDVPKGWPKKFSGPLVRDGRDLKADCVFSIVYFHHCGKD
jgi:hypothetical protein